LKGEHFFAYLGRFDPHEKYRGPLGVQAQAGYAVAGEGCAGQRILDKWANAIASTIAGIKRANTFQTHMRAKLPSGSALSAQFESRALSVNVGSSE
jgi:hypothetical protein